MPLLPHGSKPWLPILVLALALGGCKGAPTTPPPAAQAPAQAPVANEPGAQDPGVEPATGEPAGPDDPNGPDEPAPTGTETPAPTAGSPAPGEVLPGEGWEMPAGFEAKGTAADHDFIDEMVPLLQDGIRLCDDAIAKASHPVLKATATRLKTDWQERIETLKGHRKEWFGSEQVPAKEATDYSYLAAGPDFDWACADELARILQGGIDLAQFALEGTPRDETKVIAESQVKDWKIEHDQLNAWITVWLNEATEESAAP
jgi:uncharacterized protein (DUF305 family)